MKIPQYIRDLYSPTMRQWLRWLRFKAQAIAVSKKGHDHFQAYYDRCAKGRPATGGSHSCGLSDASSQSTKTLCVFPWADFRRASSFQGVSLSVTLETRDCDFRTIAETDNF